MRLSFGAFLVLQLIALGASTTTSLEKSDVLDEEDVCKGTDCALNQLQSVGAANKRHLSADTHADVASEGEQCPILAGRKKEFPPLLIPGNYKTNMKNCILPDLDLSGTWWLDWDNRQLNEGNLFIRFMQQVYDFLQFEILLTFSGCSLKGSDSFPTTLVMQVGMEQQWSYGNRWTGRVFQFFAYMFEAAGIAETELNWLFFNSTYATDDFDNYEFIYVDPDHWLRPTNLQLGPLFIGRFQYTMTRVQDGDGKQTAQWDRFTRKGANYNTWGVPRSSFCKRSLNGFAQMFYIPLSWSCWWTNLICR